jgi:3-oxoacyl-[acyl-carrier-protein] synthase III
LGGRALACTLRPTAEGAAIDLGERVRVEALATAARRADDAAQQLSDFMARAVEEALKRAEQLRARIA